MILKLNNKWKEGDTILDPILYHLLTKSDEEMNWILWILETKQNQITQ